VIKSKNTDVKAVAVRSVEGKQIYGGDMLVKPLMKGDEMTFLEIHYTAGVGSPLHTHTHESIAYVVKGKVKSTVGTDVFIMGPGDVCRIPPASCTDWKRSRTPSWSRSRRRRPTSAPSWRRGLEGLRRRRRPRVMVSDKAMRPR
jgi:quercetin dioxygenase-like cupin family protein